MDQQSVHRGSLDDNRTRTSSRMKMQHTSSFSYSSTAPWIQPAECACGTNTSLCSLRCKYGVQVQPIWFELCFFSYFWDYVILHVPTRPGGVNVGFSYPCCSSGIAEICHLYQLLSARGCSLIQYVKYISLISDDGALSSITRYSCTLGQWRPLSLQEWQDCYVCALCYCTQVSQQLQWIKLNLCVAGTMFSPKYRGYTLYHGFGFLVPHHSRTYFTFSIHFH